MKLILAAMLALACGTLHAQTLEKKKDSAAPAKTETKPETKPDRIRPAEPEHRRHAGPRHERPPVERETSEGTVKLDRVRPQPPQPNNPPSPAEQMQRQQYEQRQQAIPPAETPQQRVVQCNARPVCSGGYGRCAAVAQTYKGFTLQAGRRDIVQACVDANTPDSCNCASQCSAVARCSIF
jgi:hypothetical protein